MSKSDGQLKEVLGMYGEGVNHQRRLAAEEKLSRAQKTHREQDVMALNEQRQVSLAGTAPDEVFSEDDVAVCADFIKHMRDRDFPGSKVLANRVDHESTVKGFVRRKMGKDSVEPFSIRGYQVGVLTMPPTDTRRHRNSSQPVFLCEDGMLRVYAASNIYPGYKGDYSQRHDVSDLPLSPQTGQIAEVRFAHSDPSTFEWGIPTVHDSVEGMLKDAVFTAQRAEAAMTEDPVAV